MGPAGTVLQEVRLADAMMLSGPGAVAAQIGLLLRSKAMAAGAEHVFLLSLTGDFTGYHSTVEGYFAGTGLSVADLYGPLMVKWYADNQLPGYEDARRPLWKEVPALGRFAIAFQAGVTRGQEREDEIRGRWQESVRRFTELAKSLHRQAPLTGDLDAYLPPCGGDAVASPCGYLLTGFNVRAFLAEFSQEQQALLMGVSEGAQAPFEAVILLQALWQPGVPGEMGTGGGPDAEAAGLDFLQ
jgi:hypothetical protein